MGIKSFLKTHIGTDLLLGSWMFFVSTLIYAIISAIQIYIVVDVNTDDDYYADTVSNVFLYSLLLVVSIIFVYASAVFIYLSYPESLDKMVEQLMSQDPEKLTFWEKYFTSNDFLWMSWVFTFGFLLLFIYPIWGLSTGNVSSEECAIFIAFLMVCLVEFSLLIASTMNHNMLANEGTGSTIAFDLFCCCGCCRNSEFVKLHFKTDFMISMWGFFVFAVAALAGSIVLVAYYPTALYIWQLVAGILFFVGSILMILASYPNSFKRDDTWRFFTGDAPVEVAETSQAPDEESRLLP